MQKQEVLLSYSSGFLMAIICLFGLLAGGYMVIHGGLLFGAITIVSALFMIGGLCIINPKEAIVATFFGEPAGSLSDPGFYWVNPLLQRSKISIKINNTQTEIMKVNDGNGTPVEISAIVTWSVADPFKAVFGVEDYYSYLTTQVEVGLRMIASTHPYDGEGECLRKLVEADEVVVAKIQPMVADAGIRIIDVRISHLAYAREVAASMLRTQQAKAVVAARTTIVEGAVNMTHEAIDLIAKKSEVKLTDEQKARLLCDMMVVLVGESQAQPVLSVGG